MLKTATLLAAIALTALALPLAAAETADAKKNAADNPSAATTQDKKIENTGNETRTLPAPKKMTAEEKKADKAAKRKAPTKEEEEKAKKTLPGG